MLGKGNYGRKLGCLLAFASLTACGGGGSNALGVGDGGGDTAGGECSNNGQKQFVLDVLYAWYLWNDQLPANININEYASPEELVFRVTTELGPKDANGNTLDFFSSVGSAEADSQFFGEGQFEGFGFSWRFEGAGNSDFRITRTFPESPAANGGLARGQQVLSMNGRTVASIEEAEGINAFFDASDSVDFEVQPVTGNSFQTGAISRGVVTIDPIPQWRVIDAGNGRNVGYMELSQFIRTADDEFDTVFQAFSAANVTDVIIDMRYNGGGLVNTAELLGDYLGGRVAGGLVFSSTEFNADRAADNNFVELLELRGNSISLSRMVVVASRGTASASELVTNGLIPHAQVAIVGDNTFGKPVGQIGIEFCDKIIRPTAFRTANALGAGDYFEGLPVDCPVPDDLDTPVGDPLDPNIIAAMTWLDTGACPATSMSADSQAKGVRPSSAPAPGNARPPYREFLDAY